MKRKETKKSRAAEKPSGSRLAGTLLFAGVALVFLSAALPAAASRFAGQPDPPFAALLPAAIYLAGLALTTLFCLSRHFRGDPALAAAAFLLAGLGVAVQLRLGNAPADALQSPNAWLPLAAGITVYLAIITTLNARRLERLLSPMTYPAWFLAAATLGALIAFGTPFRGGLFLPGRINPTEIVKPLLAVFLAGWLTRRPASFGSESGGWLPPVALRDALSLALLWGIPLLLAMRANDLGLALLLNLMLVLVLTASSRRLIWLLLGGAGAGIAGWGARLLSAHARARFDVWLNPFADPTGKGWQILQSLTAMYAGGFWGTGIGAGMPETVPIVTSDFIYAALAEETGLAGCALLLLAWFIFLQRALAAADAQTPFLRLLAAGLTAALAAQILLNIGGVTKALPMTGITLPFISHGGFSLITTFATAAALTALSSAGPPEKKAKP